MYDYFFILREAEKKLSFFQQPRFLYKSCYDIVEINYKARG